MTFVRLSENGLLKVIFEVCGKILYCEEQNNVLCFHLVKCHFVLAMLCKYKTTNKKYSFHHACNHVAGENVFLDLFLY